MAKKIKLNLHQKFTKWARQVGHTQVSFAKSIGIRQPELNQILRGKKRPSADRLMKIHNGTGRRIKMDDIMEPYR